VIIPKPTTHDQVSRTIVYDVPYVPMRHKNDCWLAVLGMMHKFLVPLNPSYELKIGLSDSQQQNGVEDKQLDELMATNGFVALEEGHGAFQSSTHLFDVLLKRGPIVTRIRIDELMQHAVIVAGVGPENIYILNPANNFLSATLRAEVPFKERKKALKKELGKEAEGFKDWKARQHGEGQGGGMTSRRGSPELARRHPTPTGLLSMASNSSKSEEEGSTQDPFALLRQQLKSSSLGAQDRQRELQDQYLAEMQAHLHKRRMLAFDQFKQKLPNVARVWVAAA
jgi:hypothetical protein